MCSLPRTPRDPSAILSSIPELAGLPHLDPIHLDMTGCWQINSILAKIGRKNSIQILNLYPFLWNILIWA